MKGVAGSVEVAQVGGGVTQIFFVAVQGKAVFWGGRQVDDNEGCDVDPVVGAAAEPFVVALRRQNGNLFIMSTGLLNVCFVFW